MTVYYLTTVEHAKCFIKPLLYCTGWAPLFLNCHRASFHTKRGTDSFQRVFILFFENRIGENNIYLTLWGFLIKWTFIVLNVCLKSSFMCLFSWLKGCVSLYVSNPHRINLKFSLLQQNPVRVHLSPAETDGSCTDFLSIMR